MTLALRLVTQIVASDDTASGTRSQQLSVVKTANSAAYRQLAQPAHIRPRDTSVPGKPDHTAGTGIRRDDTGHSYIVRPERTGWARPAHIRPRDTSVPGKPDHTAGTGIRRDDTGHSYIVRPERTGWARPAHIRPRDTSVPGKPDHTAGTGIRRDDTGHSYIVRPERTGWAINSMDLAQTLCLMTKLWQVTQKP